MQIQIQSYAFAVYTIFVMVLGDHSCLRALADSPDYDDPFNARHVEQVQRALSDIDTDMCVAPGARSHEHLTPDKFNKRTTLSVARCFFIHDESISDSSFANGSRREACHQGLLSFWHKKIRQ